MLTTIIVIPNVHHAPTDTTYDGINYDGNDSFAYDRLDNAIAGGGRHIASRYGGC